MPIKSDKWIKRMSCDETSPLISPFISSSVDKNSFGESIPSYGLSSYGYDVRLGRNFKVFKNDGNDDRTYQVVYTRGSTLHCYDIPSTSRIVDLRTFDQGDKLYVEVNDVDSIVLHPGGFMLAHVEEWINVPRNVSVTAMGKSTIARTGAIVTVTPLEAGWSGITTLEISNPTRLPIKFYAGDGICQMQFHESDEDCLVSYADRDGKYQNQGKEAVTPRFNPSDVTDASIVNRDNLCQSMLTINK